MTTEEVAKQLVKLCREGKFEECVKTLYSPEVISIEPDGSILENRVQGFEAMTKKGEEWNAMIEEFHSSEISDPLVAENFFSITMKSNVTLKGMNEPMDMDEVCVYQVENGKVVTEQFFLHSNASAGLTDSRKES